MLQVHKTDLRNKLRLTASALVIATAAFAVSGAASADTITLSDDNSPYDIQGSTDTVVVASDTSAYLTASYNSIPDGYLGLVWDDTGSFSPTSSCAHSNCAQSAYIETEAGSTLYIDNPWGWQAFNSVFYAEGDVILSGTSNYFMGTNSFLGDVTLEDGAQAYMGVSWSAASNVFGEDTNIIMGSGTELDIYETSATENTISTIYSTDSTAVVNLYKGQLTVDGANTTDTAFYGTLNLYNGANFVVGDEDNTDAVFGDPSASGTTTINVYSSSGTLSTLSGYGTIYGDVINEGSVQPGGGDSTGVLTINGDYTMDSDTSELVIDMTPDGASELVVNGTATLDGSLVVNVADGNYGNAIYTILEADSVSGSLTLSDVDNDSALIGIVATDTGYNIVTEKASSAQTFGHLMTANRHFVEDFNHALYDQMDFHTNLAHADDKASYHAWMQPYFRKDNVGRGGLGYDNSTVGVMGGVEYRQPAWKNAIIGAAFTYGHSTMDTAGEDTKTHTDAYALALYGGVELQYARLDGTVFYNSSYNTVKRDMGEDYGTAESKPDSWSYGATFQISHNVFNNVLEPFARGEVARNHTDAASESGGEDFDLRYDAIDKTTFVGDLGFRFHILQPKGEQKLKLDASLSIQHDFSGTKEITTGGFTNVSDSSFTYNWDGNSENALLAGVQLGGEVYPGLQLYGRLNGQFTANQRSGMLSVGGRYRF